MPNQRYDWSIMTPKFKRILEAGFWFLIGFLAHWLLLYLHHHPNA
jgi:hypothetical protein